MEKTCELCGKNFSGRKERRFCSKSCADKAHSIYLQLKRKERENIEPTRFCEWCGNKLEFGKGRFCNRSCSAKWRMRAYGPVKVSEEGKKHQAEAMKNNWNNSDFRESNYKRMTENNPSKNPETIKKDKTN